ncbi:MAG: hypothetical protein IKV62_01430 [Bacteroidales bacterium]|nr:hypothetical protein [Bacteroidales bacterium]
MDIEHRKLIDRYLDEGEAEFDRILAEGESKRRRKVIRWTALAGTACAAAVALLLWLVPARKAAENPLTPIQIAEGIQQMMLLDIGDVDSIVATPKDSYAILTARLKDGSTCSYILKCNDAEGTATLLAYSDNN